MLDFLTPTVRRWIYGVAIAALPLLISWGAIAETDAPLIAALIGAVLVPGVAIGHVSDTPVDSE